jgi:enolase
VPAITTVKGREVLDSRGNPTVEADVVLDDGAFGRASVPSGASTGEGEALELRDGGRRYLGRGVRRAVDALNQEIARALRGRDADQQDVDRLLIDLDGTPNKSRLGANAVLAVSLALARAIAASRRLPLYRLLGGHGAVRLPVPLMNILNGGAHADNDLDIQEFMIAPVRAARFSDALRMGVEVFHTLKGLLHDRGLVTAVGDEGGFAPRLGGAERALEFLVEAIARAGYAPGEDVFLALDVAASELASNGTYRFARAGTSRTVDEMGAYYRTLSERYPIRSLEDPLGERDWEGWRSLTEALGRRVQLVGDDLFVTSRERLQRGVRERIANAILVKPNQVGTLTETLETVAFAHSARYTVILSHRSGETEDPIVADIAVGTGAQQIKIGAPSRSDRVAKYNQLLRIEEELGDRATYAGAEAFLVPS